MSLLDPIAGGRAGASLECSRRDVVYSQADCPDFDREEIVVRVEDDALNLVVR
jgi:hypothetical protein